MYKLIMQSDYATFEQLFISEIELMKKFNDLKGLFKTYKIEIIKESL
jgi:hypothetical protein